MAEKNQFTVRNATVEDLKFPTRFAIENCWRPFGPGDYLCAFRYDPDGFFVGEIAGEVVTHLMAVTYPGHSVHCGSYMVNKEYRKKGYGTKMLEYIAKNHLKSNDDNITVGLDSLPYMISFFESHGFNSVWENFIALLSFEKIVSNLQSPQDPPSQKKRKTCPAEISLKPIRTVDVDKLVQYDAAVFGCLREELVKNWIKIPGSLGWVAFDENGEVVGYTMVRPIILGAGMEIGMNMAPLYAENNEVARELLKQAAKECRANEAVSATEFLLIYARSAEHSKNATELFDKAEAEYIPFATRMYTQGVPKSGQLSKIYGIMHPTFD